MSTVNKNKENEKKKDGKKDKKSLAVVALLLLVILLIMLLLKGRNQVVSSEKSTSPKEPTTSEEFDDYQTPIISGDQTVANEGPRTLIDLITYNGDYISVKSTTYLSFGNREENQGKELQYVVYEDGNKVYTSPRIPAGKSTKFYPSQFLDTGKHNLNVDVNVYIGSTDNQDIGMNMDLVVKVE